MYTDIYSFLKTIDNSLIIVECGGHNGVDTLKLSKIFLNGMIYCIEANKKLYENLLINFKNVENVKLFNMALSNNNNLVNFYIDENPDGDCGASSLLESSDFYLKDHIKKENIIEVQGITLKYFLEKNNLDIIDFLWLDVEGFEYYILENNTNILKNIKYIYTEVNFQEFRKKTKLYEDIKVLLLNNNFEEIQKWSQGDEWGKWQGNVLFKNKLF